jgi:glycosyltransferase involved in cell wall biosynthesis
MKVAYLAPIFDGTGYAEAAVQYILALDLAGIDVVPRSIKMTNTTGDVPDRIKELEQNDTNNVDAIIQHNLPSEFVYKRGVQNIGMYAYETNTINYTGWATQLSIMDKLIVFSPWQVSQLGTVNEGQVHILPHAINTSKYNQDGIEEIDLGLTKTSTKFYTVSEFNRRKNLHTMIVGYFSAFSSSDDVALIIKTNNGDSVKKLVEDIKTGMNKFKNNSLYPSVVIIGQRLTEPQLLSLHKTCDVFVSTSYGEAWCLPMMDAIAYNNHLIVPKHTAFATNVKDYPKTNYVDTHITPVFGADSGLPNLYTANEFWWGIDMFHLVEQFVDAYEVPIETPRKVNMKFLQENYSLAAVGHQFKQILER